MANKRFSGPDQLTNAAVTKYTCPGSTVATVTRIRVINPTAGAVNFKMSLGADAAGTRIYDQNIGAGGALDAYGPFTLTAGQIIQAYAGANASLVLVINGTEVAA
jgi:hypothetical protein